MGNVATALSGLISDRVNMSVPNLRLIDVEKMAEILGGPEHEVVGILVNMTGEVEGMLLFLLDRDFVGLLVKVLLNEDVSGFDNISEMGLSALMEIGNILAGAYTSAIASMTELDIRLSTPQIAADMAGAILSYPAALFGTMGDRLLLIEEKFSNGSNTVRSHLLIMPDLKSLNKILKKLEL